MVGLLAMAVSEPGIASFDALRESIHRLINESINYTGDKKSKKCKACCGGAMTKSGPISVAHIKKRG